MYLNEAEGSNSSKGWKCCYPEDVSTFNVSVILVITVGGVKFAWDTENYDATAPTRRAFSKYIIYHSPIQYNFERH